MSGSLPNNTDPNTLARLKAGDMTALGAVFKLYGLRVYRLVRRMMGNEADAVDATQEIFVRAFEQAHKFDGRSEFYTWLYRLAVWHCLNKLKQRKRADANLRSASAGVWAARQESTPTPLENLIAEEQSGLLDRAVLLLPPNYRACLVLREVEGLSYAQIATYLEIPVGTVMSRLARARRTLRANLIESLNEGTPGNNAIASVVQTREERARYDVC